MSSLHCLQNVFFLGTRQSSLLKACMLCRHLQLGSLVDGGFGSPKKKFALLVVRILLKFRWHLKMGAWKAGYLKFFCKKNTSKVSCYFRDCTSCLCINRISAFFSLRKMDLKKLHDATFPINWCKSYPRQNNCSESIVFCFNSFLDRVRRVVL